MTATVAKWLQKELGLEVNREKSGTGPSRGSSLLGFRLYEDGRIGISPKAIVRMKEKVRECWDARQSKTSEELRDQWQRYIRGWWNYFQLADWRSEVRGGERMDKTSHAEMLLVKMASPTRAHECA